MLTVEIRDSAQNNRVIFSMTNDPDALLTVATRSETKADIQESLNHALASLGQNVATDPNAVPPSITAQLDALRTQIQEATNAMNSQVKAALDKVSADFAPITEVVTSLASVVPQLVQRVQNSDNPDPELLSGLQALDTQITDAATRLQDTAKGLSDALNSTQAQPTPEPTPAPTPEPTPAPTPTPEPVPPVVTETPAPAPETPPAAPAA